MAARYSEINLCIIHVFVKILVYELTRERIRMYNKFCKGVMKL